VTLALALAPAAALASNGGAVPVTSGGASPLTGGTPAAPPRPPTPAPAPPTPVPIGSVALVGLVAHAVPAAPAAVQAAVRAGNRLRHKPYRFGGGHASFHDSAYDCSGAVSYVLHGGGLLDSPLDSRSLERWGEPGPGAWITVYANRDHAFVVVGGLRLDTSGPGASGPRWRPLPRSLRGFVVRHPAGL
jgi:cell wall-associated NlpC family hydrolase